ncbi:L-aspartate oxidase [Formosa maritima]|uniref:L-aspartate oxidase n=1 Tax=Formosa maritima TaxID=2592046 RepID=A0A5D0G2R9_9FLAO|nr:L-aspartate oxidase [Formosa maritima]TYA52362.1 L-aspartate oxidase [Formosa maritima]
MKTHLFIIGSGVAGLTLAVKFAERFPKKKITIVTKGDADESNTKYAQGGVAVVLDEKTDSFQKHIEDTLIAGDGLCDKAVVDMVITEGPKRLKELMVWGAQFDVDKTGNLDLGKEGGHSQYRVVHHKDITGYEIERALLSRVHQLENISLLPHHFAIDLITEHQLKQVSKNITCYGAYVLNQKNGEILTIQAESTVLAAGGIGRVYGHTTNPTIATGDGIAMAYRAKARIKDMEFVQFHPTALYSNQEGSAFLISEAVRGFGAYLRTKNGNRFMLTYDDRAELASRDIVSQCIDNELKKSGESCVYLDCTHLDLEAFKCHFPNIYQTCLENNIDISKNWIPVVPASHYLCGGIEVDAQGKTSITNLFACGECTRTGLHGANRLASNSLLEALVYAHNIYKYHCGNSMIYKEQIIPSWNDDGTNIPKEHIVIKHNLKELQSLMRDYVGIVRSNYRLNKAITHLDVIYKEVEELYRVSKISTTLCELRNMINVAHLIIGQSLNRKENKGGYYNIDNL